MDPSRYDSSQPQAIQEGIFYRPWPAFLRVFLTVLMVVFAGFVLGMVFVTTRTVTVDASRAAGVLVVTRSHPLTGARRQTFPLATLHGTALFRSRDKHGRDVYSLALVTDSGVEKLSILNSGAERIVQQRSLDRFLADPGAPALRLVYDRPRPWSWAMLLFVAIMIWVERTVWQWAVVRVEGWRGAVLVMRSRWPLGREVLTFRKGDIARAYVQQRAGRRQVNTRLALTLTSGDDVPVLRSWGGDRNVQEAAARRINDALGTR